MKSNKGQHVSRRIDRPHRRKQHASLDGMMLHKSMPLTTKIDEFPYNESVVIADENDSQIISNNKFLDIIRIRLKVLSPIVSGRRTSTMDDHAKYKVKPHRRMSRMSSISKSIDLSSYKLI